MSDAVVNTLLSGALAGGFADIVTHPVCTIKARLMAQGAASTAAAEGAAETVVYKGLVDGFRRTIAAEGPLAVYKGLGVVLLGAAPAQALYFGGMKGTQAALGDSSSANFVAGLAAQLTGSLTWVPMEVIKEKMMIQGQLKTVKTHSGSFSMIANVLKNEGVLGVYRGFWMQQLTYGPFNGIAIATYNEVKKLVPETQRESSIMDLACSAFGFGFAATVTNPFDVIKTRRQIQASNPALFNYTSAIDCARQLLQKEGAGAFFDGLSGRVGWLLPRCALAMTGFEYVNRHLSGTKEEL